MVSAPSAKGSQALGEFWIHASTVDQIKAGDGMH